MEASQEARAIAAGNEPYWEGTFEHPDHGELTFRVKRKPQVMDWLAHTNAQYALTGDAPSVLSGAVAGLQTFVECPVIREEPEDDNPDGDYVRVKQVRYDPLTDEHMEFPVQVFGAFFKWRAETLSDDTREQVKNSSGATSGPSDGEPLPEPTASPPLTAASVI